MKFYGDDAETAAKNVARADADRAAYYTFLSGQKWGDKAHYDLCVDSSVGAERTAELIANYVRARMRAENPAAAAEAAQ